MPIHPPPTSLYLTDGELGKYVLGAKRAKEWAPIAIILEREGLPRIDTLMGGRYWPAVLAFLSNRHGLRREVIGGVDGKENWD